MENIVFICIDCLREDFIQSEHADTPFLDSLAEDSLHFRNLYSTTTTTTPCVTSYFTGTYSEKNGVNTLKDVELSDDIATMAEKLREEGYNTHAEVTGPLFESTGLDRGFDEYNHRGWNESLFTEWENEIHDKVEDLKSPYFLYLHLWELHGPVRVPEEFDSEEYGKTEYARALSALDRKLENLIEKLPEDTKIVLTGDHGESLTWWGHPVHEVLKQSRTLLRYKLGLNTRPLEIKLNQFVEKIWPSEWPDHFIEEAHAETVFDFTTNVPFMVKGDEVESNEIDTQVRQIDIFPTILDLAEIDEKPEYIDGKTLLQDNIEERTAYIRACGMGMRSKKNWAKAVRKDGWKLITYPGRDWNSELYDIDNNPKELHPVNNEKKKEDLREIMPDDELKEVKELQIKSQLRDLGYGS